MFLNKVGVLIIACNFVVESRALEEMTSKEDNVILITESILRNATNKLFLELGLNKRGNQKIKQALLVHHFFTEITLKDQQTLNFVVKLSRVNKYKWSNESVQCIEILNELLNEDWNGNDVDLFLNNEGIIDYIDDFLYNLNEFKEKSGYNNGHGKLDIKEEIIHILKSENPLQLKTARKHNATAIDDDGGLDDDELWVPQPSRRIYRGNKTKIKYFPFMASIQIFGSFYCAGSIIQSDLILTAASCLQLAWNNRFFRENPAFLSVRVGSSFYGAGGEEIPVMEVYFYPDYDPKNLRNNIAVLRLLRHLKFRKKTKKLKKISIDEQSSPLPMTTDGITIIGWGAKGSSNIVNNPWKNQLAFAVLDVYHLEECRDIYSRQYVTHTNFCAGFISKGGGACNQDVGGPGVVNGILTGIISFGSPVCGTPDAPTVFTKVGYYASWIENIMDQDVPRMYKKTTHRIPTIPYSPQLPHSSFDILPIQPTKTTTYQETNTENLRLLEEEDLFREFLSTVFNSKEVKEFDELFNELPMKKSHNSSMPIRENTQKSNKKGNKLFEEHFGSVIAPKLEINNKYRPDNVNADKSETSKETSEETDSKLDNEEKNHELETDKGYHTEISKYSKPSYSIDRNKIKRFTVLDLNLVVENGNNDKKQQQSIPKIAHKINTHHSKDTSSSSGTSDDSTETEVIKNDHLSIEENRIVSKQDIGVTKLDTDFRGKANKFEEKKAVGFKSGNILTVLYMTDDDRRNSTLENIVNVGNDDIKDIDDHFSEGLTIEGSGQLNGEFRDLTFRNNETRKSKHTSIMDFLSKTDLYAILTEAFDELVNNKKLEKH